MMKRFLKDEEDTKDAIQDLMVKLWDRRNDIDGAVNRNSYIVVIAKNYCLDSIKKKKFVSMRENDQKILNLVANEPSIETKEKLDRVNQVIEKLPEKYKEIIRLRDIDGFSFDEISAMTGFEIPHLRVILSRSRMKVREELIKIYDYERGTDRIFAGKIL